MPLAPGIRAMQQVRASAALPAAGAWDATPLELAVAYAQQITLFFTYTRGAAGGAFDFQLEVSPYSLAALAPAGANEWADGSAYAVGAVAAGADTTSLVQDEIVSFTSQGAAAESFVFGPIEVRGGIERIRIPCRESGVVGTPGTLQVELLAQ